MNLRAFLALVVLLGNFVNAAQPGFSADISVPVEFNVVKVVVGAIVDPNKFQFGASSEIKRETAEVMKLRPDLELKFGESSYLKQMRYSQVHVSISGDGLRKAYIFTPNSLVNKQLPIVIFQHGWMGMNPRSFGALIDMLVRRGTVVIYPVYQNGQATSPQDVTNIAGEASLEAIKVLNMRFPGLADTNRTVYFGYSMGAAISMNLALAAEKIGLPSPKAMLLISPGDAEHVAKGVAGKSIYGSVENLPINIPVILISGIEDTEIGVPTARKLAERLCRLKYKALVLLPPDKQGDQKVFAGHGSPGAPDSRYDFGPKKSPPAILPIKYGFEKSSSLNQIDFFGYWRFAIELLDYGNGKPLPAYIFGNNSDNRYLGSWSDGTPLAPAIIEPICQ